MIFESKIDTIICIINHPKVDLIFGKEYKVYYMDTSEVGINLYGIVDESGEINTYNADYFMTPHEIRMRKLVQLIG